MTAKEILGTSDKAVYGVLEGLKKKKRIKQIRGGLYLLAPAKSGIEAEWTEHIFTILPSLLKTSYYVGFWSALSYWGMTEQIPEVTYVVVTRQRRKLQFDGRVVQFITYPETRFFGYEKGTLGNTEFNISDREKTIVDSLAHPEYVGGISEAAKAIWMNRDEIKIAQLIDYSQRMNIKAVRMRLGYLLKILGFGEESYNSLLPNGPTGAPWLDPSSEKRQIKYSSRWGLRLNVPEKVILHWK